MRDRVLPDPVATQLGGDLAGREDHDPVAEAFQLPDVGRHDDHPGARVSHLPEDAVDLGPGADVDSRGRLVRQQQRDALVEQRPGQQDLLLVTPGQAQHVGVDRGGLDGQAVPLRLDGPGLGALVHHPPAAELAERGDHRVLPDRQCPEEALAEPVRGQVHHARLQRGVRLAWLERHAAQVRPAGRGPQPRQRAQEFALPVAHDAGQPDDLARRGGQRDVVEGPGGKVLHGQHRGITRPGAGA